MARKINGNIVGGGNVEIDDDGVIVIRVVNFDDAGTPFTLDGNGFLKVTGVPFTGDVNFSGDISQVGGEDVDDWAIATTFASKYGVPVNSSTGYVDGSNWRPVSSAYPLPVTIAGDTIDLAADLKALDFDSGDPVDLYSKELTGYWTSGVDNTSTNGSLLTGSVLLTYNGEDDVYYSTEQHYSYNFVTEDVEGYWGIDTHSLMLGYNNGFLRPIGATYDEQTDNGVYDMWTDVRAVGGQELVVSLMADRMVVGSFPYAIPTNSMLMAIYPEAAGTSGDGDIYAVTTSLSGDDYVDLLRLNTHDNMFGWGGVKVASATSADALWDDASINKDSSLPAVFSVQAAFYYDGVGPVDPYPVSGHYVGTDGEGNYVFAADSAIEVIGTTYVANQVDAAGWMPSAIGGTYYGFSQEGNALAHLTDNYIDGSGYNWPSITVASVPYGLDPSVDQQFNQVGALYGSAPGGAWMQVATGSGFGDPIDSVQFGDSFPSTDTVGLATFAQLAGYHQFSDEIERITTHHSDQSFSPDWRHVMLNVSNQQVAWGRERVADARYPLDGDVWDDGDSMPGVASLLMFDNGSGDSQNVSQDAPLPVLTIAISTQSSADVSATGSVGTFNVPSLAGSYALQVTKHGAVSAWTVLLKGGIGAGLSTLLTHDESTPGDTMTVSDLGAELSNFEVTVSSLTGVSDPMVDYITIGWAVK